MTAASISPSGYEFALSSAPATPAAHAGLNDVKRYAKVGGTNQRLAARSVHVEPSQFYINGFLFAKRCQQT